MQDGTAPARVREGGRAAGIVAAVRTVHATRYVTPLREGGSMPGLVEGDDDGLYVLKFRGAGQGPKALAAEVVVGELARSLGLPVPELVLIELDAELARAEPGSARSASRRRYSTIRWSPALSV